MRKNMVVSRAGWTIAALVLLIVPSMVSAQARDVLFTQRDVTIEFNLDFDGVSPAPIGGHGVEAGTVSGAIQGASLTNFMFRGLSLDNRVGIADLDGDRIIFKKTGTGTFLPPLNDPTSGAGFQVFGLTGSNIVLTGTYEVVQTTGKYTKKYRIGDQFPFTSIATNPSWPPASTPKAGTIVPGSEYVEVYINQTGQSIERGKN
jgi:hypothetical protein